MKKIIISKIMAYYHLTKPGISRAQILTVSIGYFLATQEITFNQIYFTLITGTLFFSSAASIGNNIIESDLDRLMNRTKDRGLPSKKITVSEAIILASIFTVIGSLLLLKINGLCFAIAMSTLLIYVFLYTPLKQVSWINTLVGAIPGALPLIGGWAAAGVPIHVAGIALTFTLFCWQIPHFFALSIMYLDDYKAANFKMLPIEDPEFRATKRQIIIFTILMILSSVYPFFIGFLSSIYFFGVLFISTIFFVFSIKVIQNITKKNARKLFFLSIIYLPLWFILILCDILISLN